MEIFGIAVGLAAFWIVAAVILIIIEALTLGLTTIWFAGGAIAAAIAAMITSSLIIQIAVFLIVSIILLFMTKPLRNKLRIGKEKTNVEAIIGKTGFVIETISPAAFGQAKIGGIMWTSAAADPEAVIESGTEITVIGVEGVKLIVVPYARNA